MKCVYKIICRDKEITEFYIGSSIEFNNRKFKHQSYCNNLNNNHYCYPLYMFINVNGGFENWEFEFITKKELEMNEQYYKDLLKPHLNSKNSYGNDIERYKKYHKIYNKMKANCPHCGKEMNKTSITRHINKKWCKNN